ncbi:MAG TPA: response regulator [Candidatus Acidoferrales bacterium]|jgi:chemotaxis protein MotB|nr:response regulator [Candidatus Acidoferrales bacterium]
MRILVAEDDPPVATFLRKSLEAEQYAVDTAADGAEAKYMAESYDYDLLILDINLPKMTGFEVLKEVRLKKPHIAILILTGNSQVPDRVKGLDLGADDYLTKPFSLTELSARIRALMRRSGRPFEAVLRVEDLVLDRVQRVVRRAEQRIELTPKEFGLLEFLMRNAGRRVTRSMIVENVWNLGFDTLFAFFVVLFSSAQVNHRKVGQIAMAIQVAFQQMGVFESSNTHMPLDKSEPMPFEKVQVIENTMRDTDLSQAVPPMKGVISNAPDREAIAAIRKNLESTLAGQIEGKTVGIHETREGLVVSLREIGFFDSGSATLRPGAERTLKQIADVLRALPESIRIEGHTDDVPIHNAAFPSNWELSTARATEIVKLFITRYQMDPARLQASGYAQYHPAAPNDDAAGRALNRRVDIVIVARDKPAQIADAAQSRSSQKPLDSLALPQPETLPPLPSRAK